MSTRLLLAVFVLVCALPFQGQAQNQVLFPHTATGDGYQTDFLLMNQRSEDATVWMYCFRPNGQDWYLTIRDGATVYTAPFQFKIPRNSVRKLETTADPASPLETGWCQLSSSASLNGHLVFKFPYGETSIPSLRTSCGFKVLVEFSASAGRTTGLAIASPANSSGLPNRVKLDLVQDDGVVLDSKTIQVPHSGQEVAFIQQEAYFSSLVQKGEFLGSIKVQSEWPVTLTSVGWKNESGGIYFFNNTPPIDTRDTCSGSWNTLSQGAKDFIRNYGLQSSNFDGSGMGFYRWVDFPINLYATSDLGRQDVMVATKFWENETNGKVTFRIVDNQSEADVVLDTDYRDTRRLCAVAASAINGGTFELTAGIGNFNKAIPECWEEITRVIAHELGHIIGIIEHSPDNTDIMSAPNAGLKLSLVSREVINWAYTMPAGMVVPK